MVWAVRLLDVVARDVRYALRGMRRTPGFTVVETLLVRPLPYGDADRLVTIDATRDYEGTSHPIDATFPLDAAARWRDALRVFDDIGLYADGTLQLTRHDAS